MPGLLRQTGLLLVLASGCRPGVFLVVDLPAPPCDAFGTLELDEETPSGRTGQEIVDLLLDSEVRVPQWEDLGAISFESAASVQVEWKEGENCPHRTTVYVHDLVLSVQDVRVDASSAFYIVEDHQLSVLSAHFEPDPVLEARLIPVGVGRGGSEEVQVSETRVKLTLSHVSFFPRFVEPNGEVFAGGELPLTADWTSDL